MPASFPPPAQNLFNGVTTNANAMTALGLTAANSFGLVVGSPTGGNMGAGTVNATGLYVNGTAIGSTSVAAITSGTINGATIGISNPKAATFTSVGMSNTNLTMLPNPAAPTVTNVGTAGLTTVTYGLVAVFADGTTSAIGVVTASATSNATLNGSNYNTISWSATPSASSIQVWRTAAGGTPSTLGLIGTVTAGTTTFNDTGVAGNAATAPIWNNTGVVFMNGTPVIQFAQGYRGSSFVPDAENTFVGWNAGGGVLTSQTCIENTAVGYYAGGGFSTGNVSNRNTSMGYGTLAYIQSGSSNVAIGNNCLYGELIGNDNTAVGADVARLSVGNNTSVAIGCQAIYNTVVQNCIAIGFQALYGAASATAAGNIVIGNQSFSSAALVNPTFNTTAGYQVFNNSAGLVSPFNNTVLGSVIFTGNAVASPNYNVLIGSNIFVGNTVIAPYSNVCVGNNIGNSAAIGPNSNTFVGHSIANALTGGNGNCAVGNFALRVLTSGGTNVAVGQNAANKITTGGANLVLGPNVANTTLTTGSSNIFIGVSSAIDAATGSESNVFRIGNNATNLMRATGINTATPAFFLDWLPTSTSYATDTTASAGGIAIGQLYRNGSIVQCRIT